MIIQEAKRLNSIEEYYFSQKLRQIAEINRNGGKVINLGIGSPDLDPTPQVLESLRENALIPGVHGYQSYKGIPELRSAICNWSEELYGTEPDPETEVLPLMGSKEGIMHISLAFVNEGDGVLIPNPGYPTYTSVSKITGARIFNYDVQEAGIDINQIERISNEHNIKLMWLNFPHMPTGIKADKSFLQQLVELAKRKKFLLVNDNPYSTILTKEYFSIFQIQGAKEVCLELNSLSKSHNMAGWRIGWLCGNSELINTVLKVKSNMDSGMFLPLQKAAIKALETGKSNIDMINEEYRKRRKIAWQIFDLLDCTYSKDAAGMFVWGKINAIDKSSNDLAEELLAESKVFITPGFIFGSNGENHLRISLCSKTEVLNEALDRVALYICLNKGSGEFGQLSREIGERAKGYGQ